MIDSSSEDLTLTDKIKPKPRGPKRPFSGIIASYKRDPVSWSVIIFITVFFSIFLIIPLGQVLVASVYVKGEFRFQAFRELFNNPTFFNPKGDLDKGGYIIRIDHRSDADVYLIRGPNLGIFLNTIVIGVLTTLISLILGVFSAILMARVEFRGKALLGGLLLIPLVLPPFVSGVGFFALLGDNGIFNERFLSPVFGIKIVLEGIAAIVFVQSLHYFTLIHLNVYSSLMNTDPSMEESAENLGASRLRIMRTVTLPLALPGIASGSILVFILAMEDLGTPIIFAGFGDPIAKQTITYYIAKHIFAEAESSDIAQESAILGAILLIFALIGFFMIRKYVSLRQYSMVSKGRAGEFRTFKPGVVGKISIYAYFFFLLTIATIPHLGVLIAGTTVPQVWPLQFTGDNLAFLIDPDSGFRQFFINTITYSLIATFLIVILATLAGYVANRKKFRGQTLFDTLVTIPIAIPGIVLGIGFIKMFGGMGTYGQIGDTIITLNPIVYPPTLLVISYTIRKFPFTVRAVYAGLQQTDEVLEESAMNMGASKQRVIVEVIIPLIALNIVGGALVSLVYNMSEVSTTLILVADNTYGTLTWKMADSNGKIGELAAIGIFLMAIQTISLLVTNLLLKNRAEAISGL
ncbi:MAG: iron ABC transporter permease [Candidatus Heimdallarchaeota archaeon]|nr:iron ABC transporter permease [Candidatus Heimdallarchaeota archaeon]